MTYIKFISIPCPCFSTTLHCYDTSFFAYTLVSPENHVTIDPAPFVSVRSGDSVTLTCSTPAGPSNNYTWYFYEEACDPDLATFNPSGESC